MTDGNDVTFVAPAYLTATFKNLILGTKNGFVNFAPLDHQKVKPIFLKIDGFYEAIATIENSESAELQKKRAKTLAFAIFKGIVEDFKANKHNIKFSYYVGIALANMYIKGIKNEIFKSIKES